MRETLESARDPGQIYHVALLQCYEYILCRGSLYFEPFHMVTKEVYTLFDSITTVFLQLLGIHLCSSERQAPAPFEQSAAAVDQSATSVVQSETSVDQ